MLSAALSAFDVSTKPDGLSTPFEFGDPSRWTYLAPERTLLAWWRTGFAAVGFALAVGRLLPSVAHLSRGPFVVIGVGWGLLGRALIALGSALQRRGHAAIRARGFLHLNENLAMAVAICTFVLVVATVVMSLAAT